MFTAINLTYNYDTNKKGERQDSEEEDGKEEGKEREEVR
jgi:hypothetical protein